MVWSGAWLLRGPCLDPLCVPPASHSVSESWLTEPCRALAGPGAPPLMLWGRSGLDWVRPGRWDCGLCLPSCPMASGRGLEALSEVFSTESSCEDKHSCRRWRGGRPHIRGSKVWPLLCLPLLLCSSIFHGFCLSSCCSRASLWGHRSSLLLIKYVLSSTLFQAYFLGLPAPHVQNHWGPAESWPWRPHQCLSP